MSSDKYGYGPQANWGYGPQAGPAGGYGPQAAPGWGYGPQPGPGWGYGYGYGYGAQQGPAPRQRVDLLDVVEGVMRDGLSLSNVTRIARASGSNFWVGAAIGASAVVLARRPDVRSALGGVFRSHDGAGR